MKSSELIKLNFAKNDEGEMVDPVTFKVFTDNTHIVALRNTGNVFAWDTVERLNIKGKMWKDLVSDEEFSRKDIITLQDPQNLGARDLSQFKYLQEGVSTLTEEQERERNDPSRNVNKDALGNAAKILKAKEAVARAREQKGKDPNKNPAMPGTKALQMTANGSQAQGPSNRAAKALPYNAAQHTTGKAAASFTSTSLTPHTTGERALLTDEEYMLKPKRVKHKGYARIQTTLGDLNIELQTEHAPRAVWNFVQLSKRGYYRDVTFHRNVRNFMIQGGDPTGTGKGGASVWGANFADEFDGPLTHDARGVVSMANKGKNTNSSQFFVLYRPAKHLDRKHTVFARVVGGLDTLARMENAPTDPESSRPLEPITILDVVVFVDPFDEFLKEKRERDELEKEQLEVRRKGGTDDERTTWTGKRVRGDGTVVADASGGVGKYLKAASGTGADVARSGAAADSVGAWESDFPTEAGPPAKKSKVGGFGNFDSW